MLIACLLYGLLLLLPCFYHLRTIGDFREYTIAGGRQGAGMITLSMLASMIGGSATLGMADLAMRKGFPAFWWLGVGSVGLLVQGWLLSSRVRALNACSLADVAGKTIGEEARFISALVIAISWTGIVAAQFTALAQIFTLITGMEYSAFLLVSISAVVIVYTACGGQISVIRTDSLQCILLFSGSIIACIFLWSKENIGITDIWLNHIELLNENFGFKDLLSLFLLAGFSFVIGPDILTRNFSAANGKVAKKATFASSIFLCVFAVCITLLGIWAGRHGMGNQTENPLILIARDYLPQSVSVLLTLGLVSALISSADTCLISAATVIEHDILRKSGLRRIRIFVITIGLISLAVALLKSDIISLLLGAYAVYVPGVAIPLFIAILVYGRYSINRNLFLCGMITGGGFGFAANMLNMNELSFAGMFISGLFAMGGVIFRPIKQRSPHELP